MAIMNRQPVIFRDLGRQRYRETWDYQEVLLQENVKKKFEIQSSKSEAGNLVEKQDIQSRESGTQHYLLFVEHPPVYTLGKSGDPAHVLISEEDLQQKGIEFYKTNRGGDITFHGPEQIVGYPILDLEKFSTDLGKYLRNLEEVIILTMAEYGLKGERSAGETGVWLDTSIKGRERKICAMGIRCSRWITMHGFAFNINTDLGYFDNIVPCGIYNKQVTSLQKELGYRLPLTEVKEKVKRNFEEVFGVELVDRLNS